MATVQAPKKRKVMTLDERIRVIELSNQGQSARKIAASFGVGKTQVQSIIRNKNKITEEWENGMASNPKRKYSKVRKTKYDDLNQLVWEWFCIARTNGIPVSGRLLQSKALAFSGLLNHSDFMASNGWLESFKNRHNIHWTSCKGGEIADGDAGNTEEMSHLNDNVIDEYVDQNRTIVMSCCNDGEPNWKCTKNSFNSGNGSEEEQDDEQGKQQDEEDKQNEMEEQEREQEEQMEEQIEGQEEEQEDEQEGQTEEQVEEKEEQMEEQEKGQEEEEGEQQGEQQDIQEREQEKRQQEEQIEEEEEEEEEEDEQEEQEEVVDTEEEETVAVSVEKAARMVAELRKFGLWSNKPEIIDALVTVKVAIEQVKFDNQRPAKQSNVSSIK